MANVVRKRGKKKNTPAWNVKRSYPRKGLDVNSEQYKWIRKMAQDQMFMKLLQAENPAYYNIVKNAWDNESYSTAPIVKRNLEAACTSYAEYIDILT